MYHKLPYLKFLIGEGPRLSNNFGLTDTGAGLDLGNLDCHQLVAERHPNLVLKFVYLKDMDDVYPLNISGLYEGKENEQVKVGVDLTAIIT